VTPVTERASSLARNAVPAHVPPGSRRPEQARLGPHRVHELGAGPSAETESIIGVVRCQGATALPLMPWRPCEYAMSTVIAISPPLAAE
jgi:hypothetical protein